LEIEIKEYETKIIQNLTGEINPDAQKFLEIHPIDSRSQKLCMKGYVGAINLTKNCTLYSYPKVGIGNVLRMYDYSKRKFQVKDQMLVFKEETNFLDLLSRIFIEEVEEICRTAYRRFYAPRVENLLTLKGKVLVTETLLKNYTQPHVSCEYLDFTDDIIENRVLKYATFLQLKAFTGDFRKKALYRKMRYLYSFFDSVKLEMFNIDDVENIYYDRLNYKYIKAHYISKFFIEYLYIKHGLGGSNFYSFMINMEKLFEDFIRNIIKIYNNNFKTSKGINYLDKNRKYIKLYPDIIMKRKGKIEIILDCKYKKVRKIPEDMNIDIAKPFPSDIYQMLSYLIAYNCLNGILIYPKGECEDIEIPIQVESKEYVIKIKQIDLTKLEESQLMEFAMSLDENILA